MPRLTKEELKGNALQSAIGGFVASLRDFWGKHKEKVGIGALVVGVAVFILIITNLTVTRSNREASQLMSSGLMAYENREDEARYEKAKDIFSQVVEKYPNVKIKNEALFYLGNCFYFLGNYDEAIDAFSKSAKGRGSKAVQVYALQGTGKSYEGKGDYNKAIEIYQSLLDRYPKSHMKTNVMLDMGACYERLGKLSEASSAYQKVVDFSPESFWADEARVRINFIKDKG